MTKTITSTVEASVNLNEELKGIEISFSCKPSKDVLNNLKHYGFRWHRIKKIWWAKQLPDRLQFVREFFNVEI